MVAETPHASPMFMTPKMGRETCDHNERRHEPSVVERRLDRN